MKFYDYHNNYECFFLLYSQTAYAIGRGKVVVRYDLSSFDFIMRLKQLEHCITRGFKVYLTTGLKSASRHTDASDSN